MTWGSGTRRPSASQIAARVRGGGLSALDVINEHALRGKEFAHLNALITPLWESALEQAARIDAMDPDARAALPLAGVPVTVKDIMGVAGVRTTAGSRVWADRIAAADASAVAALRGAGAIVVGKSNLPQFALGTVTENEAFGRTLNPLDTSRTPGGSSGGEAAAIASGISAAGLGGDYGGSVRWPAQCTGIVALRPTPGRIPGTGQVPGAGGLLGDTTPPLPALTGQQGMLQVIGPMARSVEDLRLLLSVLAHPDGVDIRVPELPVPGPAQTGRVRVGWSTGAAIAPVRAEVARLIAGITAGLVPHCASVVEDPALFLGCREIYDDIRSLDPHPDHLAAIGDRTDLVPEDVLSRLMPPPGPDPVRLARAWGEAIEIRRGALRAFERFDVVLLPVAAGPAGELDGSVDVDGVQIGGFDLMAHCRAVTLLGVPVVSVPVGRSVEGLPLSVQVIAAPWREHLALDVAARLESLAAMASGGNATRPG